MTRTRVGVVAVCLLACTPENGPLMRPGEDCLRCHGESTASGQGERVERATAWSLAGTVYASPTPATSAGIEGVDVQVTDARGFAFTLHTNLVGNFYSAESVTFPLQVCVSRNGSVRCMSDPAQSGACNACHSGVAAQSEAGPIVAP